MPELPEVETTRLGILPHIKDLFFTSISIRQKNLRWPVNPIIAEILPGQPLLDITRRGKYLLFHTPIGTIIVHLGMSGHMRITSNNSTFGKHDHVDFCFSGEKLLRFCDPRKFGAILWQPLPANPFEHCLLINLGIEPLSDDCNADFLHQSFSRRMSPIKSVIMDSRIVVGIGNIYANETLFLAKISPLKPASSLSYEACQRLSNSVKSTLLSAIQQGGTTLRDFIDPSGKPGYFQQHLYVYGRNNQPCINCDTPISLFRLNQRSTFYCSTCQN